MSRRESIAVIGAGIIGACTAVELLRDGHEITIIEPDEPGGTQAASYGNGAWISPASVVPMSMPGLWRNLPRYLLDPLGPLTLRWTAIPVLLPWLVSFLRAGATVKRVEITARSLSALLSDSPARHLSLSAEAGVGDLIEQRGLLYAYPDRGAFEDEALAWWLRRDNGVTWDEIEGDDLHRFEPSLAPRYRFGALVTAGAHCLDPGSYVAALIEHARRNGASLVPARAMGFDLHAGELRAVLTNAGAVPCTRAVIAAGIHSGPLARAAGDKVRLASERGYHVEIAEPASAPKIPVMPSDGKMANTPTRRGLRASGQVELAGITAPPNWKRADVLLEHLRRTYPGLAGNNDADRIQRWMGHRPSTPDGLPVLGPAAASAHILHAFGHGHVGLACGPISGKVVADIIAGRPPPVAVEPYSSARFR